MRQTEKNSSNNKFQPLPSILIRIILVEILILGFIIIPSPITLRYFDHPYHNNDLAYALDSKYPEAGLPSPKGPIINDPTLEAEVVFKGLRYPTSMAFLGPNDILVTEKDNGTVMRIVNGLCYLNLCLTLTLPHRLTGVCWVLQ